MKYFLICFLLITSCKSGSNDTGNFNVVIGTAVNEKAGAVLNANDERYLITGLNSWDSIYLGKKVKVKGHFKLITGKDKVYIKNNKDGELIPFQAQAYSRYYSVDNPIWELYNPE